MTNLRLGSRGESVGQIQSKLKQIGFYGGQIDDDFGPLTEKAVRAFQTSKGLTGDGIVGSITWGALDLSEPSATDVGAPKRPRSYAEVRQIFGDPLQAGWEASRLGFCALAPIFKAFPLKGTTRGFYCHKLLVSVFQAVFEDIGLAGLADEVKSFDGCFSLRKIRGSSTTMSLHSWAIAIDINYVGNELANPHPAMPPAIIAIFEKHGFYWGGNFTRKDGMHFEYFDRG